MQGATSPVPVTTTAGAVSASSSLLKVVNWDGKSTQEISQVLTTAFEAEDYLACIKDLKAQNIDPQVYIDSLDKIIDTLPTDAELRKRCLRALRKTCGIHGIVPTSHVVSSPLRKSGQRPFIGGGFGDVWRFTDENHHDQVFAVKELRVYELDPIDKIHKKFYKEVIVCKRVDHPNILSIEGVAPELFEFCMVSRWMENGDLLKYLGQYPGINRLGLLVGITRGLRYLHENDVVHGDLKGPNILIDTGGSPRLCDFGLCSITKNINSLNASTPNNSCTVRYCAPELLDFGGVVKLKRTKATNESDVYAQVLIAFVPSS